MAARRRELTDEEAAYLCKRIGRRSYRLGRIYAEARTLAYETGSADVSVSSSSDDSPTEIAALDRRRAYLRSKLPEIGALIALSDSAVAQATKLIQRSDRMAGEALGQTGLWDTETAEAAERRSDARRARRRILPERRRA